MSARRFWLAVPAVLAALVFGALVARAQTGTITTVAGGGPNNLPKLSANLNFPTGVARDQGGNVYVADQDGNRVYKVDGTGKLTIFAGVTGGFGGDGGPAVSALLDRPAGVFVDGLGNVFISDTGNGLIRRVDAASLNITTVAGNFQGTVCPGASNSIGDGCPATSATLSEPHGLFVDAAGDIFVADENNSVIREVVAATGMIQTVAGIPGSFGYNGDGIPATSAQLEFPEGVYVDGSGNIFIADTFNNAVREVSGGIIRLVAGNPPAGGSVGDGGAATSAELDGPFAVFVDGAGNIFISDAFNNKVREVGGPASPGAGIIQTVAGNGLLGSIGDGGPATSAELGRQDGILVDGSGNLFIADA
ncbi:MAG TPA: hypothetical protein VKG84_12435, partial [Candidatus Acidoferrales bacterium]|nr:hypothetical protein [Candidatus Acidoferrales bacterium]